MSERYISNFSDPSLVIPDRGLFHLHLHDRDEDQEIIIVFTDREMGEVIDQYQELTEATD